MKETKDIPLAKPTLVPWKEVEPLFAKVWESGQLTAGPHTRHFEQEVCQVTGATHAIAVSSCTSGLMLLLRAKEITGEVIIPSFTWASTGHALIWNQLKPVFADCDPETFTLDPVSVSKKIKADTKGIFAANIFGLSPDFDKLRKISQDAGIPLYCDSAQAIGAKYHGQPAGSICDAEVFSLSPTKVVTAIEGGMITTNDDDLAGKLYQMRDYGKTKDGMDVELFGLSARLGEINSIVGAANLKKREELILSRKKTANLYKQMLKGVTGVSFQKIPKGYESSYNYFVILVDAPETLKNQLAKKGIQSKRYFHPPLHKQISYSALNLQLDDLPNTENVSSRSLALPFYSFMADDDVKYVADSVALELCKG